MLLSLITILYTFLVEYWEFTIALFNNHRNFNITIKN